MNQPHPSGPLLIAHRGCSKRFPENTVAAFEGALGQGATWIETDVTLTFDKIPVVIHDDTVDRTTNGSGWVKDLTLKQIKTLDAGSWFDPDFSDQAIPTLAEILDLLMPRCGLNLEIKALYESRDYVPQVVQKVMELVDAKTTRNHVLISSFDPAIVKEVADRHPSVSAALLTDQPLKDKDIDFIKKSGLFSLHQKHSLITPRDVDRLHQMGVKVYGYTVNRISDYLHLARMGADGVFTDDLAALDPIP